MVVNRAQNFLKCSFQERKNADFVDGFELNKGKLRCVVIPFVSLSKPFWKAAFLLVRIVC